MIFLIMMVTLLSSLSVGESKPHQSTDGKEQTTVRPFVVPTLPNLPQVPGLPAMPTLPSIPAMSVPAVPPVVPQFLDSFSDGLSKVSAALRGPTPLKSLAPLLLPARLMPG
jgi:hypothetical protein